MLTLLEYRTLLAVQQGTFRRRPDAPPANTVPTLASLLERGLLAQRGKQWLLTEDGLAAIEAHESTR